MGNLFHWLGDKWDEGVKAVEDFGKDVVENVQDFGEDVVDTVKDAAETVRDFGEDAVDTVKNVGKNVAKGWKDLNEWGDAHFTNPWEAAEAINNYTKDQIAKYEGKDKGKDKVKVANDTVKIEPAVNAAIFAVPDGCDISDEFVDKLAEQGAIIYDVSEGVPGEGNKIDQMILDAASKKGESYVIMFPSENKEAIKDLFEKEDLPVAPLSNKLAAELYKVELIKQKIEGVKEKVEEEIKESKEAVEEWVEKIKDVKETVEKETVEKETVEVASAEFNKPITAEYEIQPGDNLSTIAKELGVDMNHLIEMNGIENPNLIVAGATLVYEIPVEEAGINRELDDIEGYEDARAQYIENEIQERLDAGGYAHVPEGAQAVAKERITKEVEEELSLFEAAYEGGESAIAELERDKDTVAGYQEYVSEISGMTDGKMDISAKQDVSIDEPEID